MAKGWLILTGQLELPTRASLMSPTLRLATMSWPQSYGGTSETRGSRPRATRTGGFNPTRVRLKRWSRRGTDSGSVGFNPTRVRLKPLSRWSWGRRSRGFNPTRVRLKRSRNTPPPGFINQLQPHEGTSETRPARSSRRRAARFNPTRVRLKRMEAARQQTSMAASTPRGYV